MKNNFFKLFPSKEKEFRFIGDPTESLERLKRRTEISDSLSSSFTDKSFKGQITENSFKLITTEIGKGAFCVMSGKIIENKGVIKVQINMAFRILISIFFIIISVLMIILPLSFQEDFSFSLILVFLIQILFIRFFFIGISFYRFSKKSLNRLSDVLDIEWV